MGQMRQLVLAFVRESWDSGLMIDEVMFEVKKQYIVNVLERCAGNQCKAANALGWHRNTLARQLDNLGIDPAEIRAASRLGKKQPASASAGTAAVKSA